MQKPRRRFDPGVLFAKSSDTFETGATQLAKLASVLASSEATDVLVRGIFQ
jgi:hypothetical protein